MKASEATLAPTPSDDKGAFGAWAVILAAMAAAILAAYLFSLATEAQTNRLRRRILAILARSASLDVHQ